MSQRQEPKPRRGERPAPRHERTADVGMLHRVRQGAAAVHRLAAEGALDAPERCVWAGWVTGEAGRWVETVTNAPPHKAVTTPSLGLLVVGLTGRTEPGGVILPGEDERVPVGEVLAVLATASLVPERAGHPDQVVKVLASHVRSVTAQPGRDYGEPGGAFYFIHERPLAVLAQRAALQLFEVIKNPDLTPEIDTLDAPTTCALVDGPVGEDGAPTSSAVRPLTDLPPGDQPFDPEKLVWSFEGTRPGCEFTESGRLVRIPELLPWGVIGQNHVRSVYWAVGDLTVHFAT